MIDAEDSGYTTYPTCPYCGVTTLHDITLEWLDDPIEPGLQYTEVDCDCGNTYDAKRLSRYWTRKMDQVSCTDEWGRVSMSSAGWD